MIPFSDEELVPSVNTVLDKVRPSLALDGGSVELVGIKDGRVFVKLTGACVGCSSSDITLKNGIERQLKNDIHPELEVVNVPPGFEDKWESL